MSEVIKRGRRVRQIVMGTAIAGLAVSLSACAPPDAPHADEWQEQAAPAQPDQQRRAPAAPAPQQDAEPIQPAEPQPDPFAPAPAPAPAPAE